MDTITRQDAEQLLSPKPGPCISLYLPVRVAGPEGQQGPIRLKNLVRTAKERLIDRGMRPADARDFVEPLLRLGTEPSFWQQAGSGLAMFHSKQGTRSLHLPLALAEMAVVSERFFIKPLLPLLAGDGRFFVLGLNQKGVRLLEATRDRMREVEVPGMPGSLDEALGYGDERRRFHNSGRQWHGGPQPNVYRGKGSLVDVESGDVAKYFRLVDRAVRSYMNGNRAPLLLAALPEFVPIYRQVNGYRNLLDAAVTINPQWVDDAALHAQAWAAAAPAFAEEQKQAAGRYWQLAHSDRATSDIQEVVRAAVEGRVDVLFVNAKADVRGDLDEATGRPVLHAKLSEGRDDLVDVAAAETLRHGGTVYAGEAETVPGGAPMAAILRFAESPVAGTPAVKAAE
ncbi:MAG: hypothetical protein HYS13_21905 [Planctomycetia bacterium]|nr:hypothetical protein [Planctomycetia bacterium]